MATTAVMVAVENRDTQPPPPPRSDRHNSQPVTLRSRDRMWYYSDGTRCVLVEKVMPGSAAEAAGIQSGDLILKLEDEQITSGDALSGAISAYKPGDKATLTIQRDGQELTVEVTFGEYAPQK